MRICALCWPSLTARHALLAWSWRTISVSDPSTRGHGTHRLTPCTLHPARSGKHEEARTPHSHATHSHIGMPFSSHSATPARQPPYSHRTAATLPIVTYMMWAASSTKLTSLTTRAPPPTPLCSLTEFWVRPAALHGMLRQASLAIEESSKLVPWVILGGCWAMDSLDDRGLNQASKYTRTPAPGGGWLLVARDGTPRGSRCVGAFAVAAFGAELILRQTLVSEARLSRVHRIRSHSTACAGAARMHALYSKQRVADTATRR